MNSRAVRSWKKGFGEYLMVAIAVAWGTLWVTSPCNSAQDTWTQKASFGGTARNNAVAFSIGSKGYVGTGYDDSYRKDFWEYDPSSNTWTQKADFGGAGRYCAVGFSIGTKGYVGTGFDGGPAKDFWEYDPSSNRWTRKADFPGAARSYAVGFSVGMKGYVGTGATGSVAAKDFWEYDPSSDTWTRKADFPGVARYCAVGFSIGTKGYVGTGYDGTWSAKDFWEYDPSSDTWTRKADLGEVGRWSAFGFSIGTKGYVGTGYDGSYKKDLWEYDPSSNTWGRKADFGGAARFCAVSFSIGATGYVGTGSNSSFLGDFWEYAGSGYYLVVFKSGAGTGAVTSSPSGIDCGLTCSTSFDQNAVVNLTAVADASSTFAGWAGDCSGNATTQVLTMNVSKSCTAIFGEAGGSGSVSTPLSAGWNFISFPKQPPDTAIKAVLADVSPSIRIVWGYDNEKKIWKRYKPGETANTLPNMEAGKGYWIYANNESAINMTGCTDPSATVHLYEGWNLVGYSGTDNKEIAASLDPISDKWSLIWNWDKGIWKVKKGSNVNAALFFPELTTLSTGRAYWIRTRAGQTANWVQRSGATTPGSPTNLMAAEVSDNQINLTWADASGNVGVSGYYVYQGATKIADVKTTSFSITNFDANAQYSYTIKAYDASGNISASSALLTVGGGSNSLNAATSGTGSGTITSVPAGINCGSICSITLIKGTSVTLTATPGAGSAFANWSGACTGIGTCVVTIDGDKSATAIFNPYRVEASAHIGPAGGVVEITEASNPLFGTKVDIPAGALAQETTITISSVSNPPLASGGLTPSGPCAEFGPSGLQFSKPVAITLPSHSTDLAHTSDLIFFDSGGFTIVPNPNDEDEGLTQTIDLAHNRVTAFTNHFTLYQVLEDADIEEQIKNTGPNSKTFIGYKLPPNKNPLKTREETKPIQSIVIHSTDDTLNLSQHASRLNHGATNLFATYYIDACGRILQVAQENEQTNHAYTSNTGSIGIELLDVIDEKCDDVSGSYSTAQTKALQSLTEELVQKYNVSADNIVRHYDIAQKIDCTKWDTYPTPLPWKDQKGCEDYRAGWKQDPMAWDNDEWNAFKSSLPSLLCTYSLGAPSKEFGATAGSGSISVTTQSGCSWTATSDSNWLVTTSSGNGLGMAEYSVAANTGTTQRTGTITIRGQTFTVTQAAPSPFKGSLAGYWAGSCTAGGYTEDVIGQFSIAIDADGKVSGNYTGPPSGSIDGTVSTTGSYSAGGSAGGYSWSGTITRSGDSLSGFGDWNGSDGVYSCKGSWAGPG